MCEIMHLITHHLKALTKQSLVGQVYCELYSGSCQTHGQLSLLVINMEYIKFKHDLQRQISIPIPYISILTLNLQSRAFIFSNYEIYFMLNYSLCESCNILFTTSSKVLPIFLKVMIQLMMLHSRVLGELPECY